MVSAFDRFDAPDGQEVAMWSFGAVEPALE